MDFKKLFNVHSDGLTFAIKVSPKSKKNYISNIFLDQKNQSVLKIYITAPPEDGKANDAIVKLLAKTWKLKKNQIKIIFGLKDKNKIIIIEGNPKNLLEYLGKLIKFNHAE